MPGADPGALVNAIRHGAASCAVSYKTFARFANLDFLRREGHPAMYRISCPDNWSVSFHRSRLPSGAPVYFFVWSGIEHFFVQDEVDVAQELAHITYSKVESVPQKLLVFGPSEQSRDAQCRIPHFLV
jgi:hypothetical protein